MTGAEIRAIRLGLELTIYEWGRALGYQGERQTVTTAVRRYEAGERDVPPWIGRLATMYQRHGIPPEWL